MEQPKNVYISKAGYLLITGKELKNGTIYGTEINSRGFEEVEWKRGEEKNPVGKALPVYAVVDNGVLTEQLPFYFQRAFAVSAAKQMNEDKRKYKVKKVYLFYPPEKISANKLN